MPTEKPIMEDAADRPLDGEWLEQLRARFVEIAARRVEADAVEDLAQDALRVVLEKSGDLQPRLDSCFQILRNVIGNHYRRTRTRRRFMVDDPDGTRSSAVATPGRGLEILTDEEAEDLIHEGIAAARPPCPDYLRRLAAGAAPARIATEAGLEAAVFYRRLYRCRQKLRQWLRDRGVAA